MSEELDGFRIPDEPYYHASGDEVRLFEAAFALKMPVMLKGRPGPQDALCRTHGLQARQAAGDRCLP